MAAVASTCPIGNAGALTGPAMTRRSPAGAGFAAPASSTVPHAWHSPHRPAHLRFERAARHHPPLTTVGIGDGGNEIGMGKVPHDVIRRNVPGGDRIACRVATDHLIVAGVSNWGGYALAAGVALLRGATLPAELFDAEREREILRVMVEAGPLVDGVAAKATVTVDGLTFEEYVRPLVELGKM